MKKKILLGSILTVSMMFPLVAYAQSNSAQSQFQVKGPNLTPGKVYTAEQLGIKLHHPPAGFNPLTGTNAELLKYGFPKPPTDPTALKEWQQAMSHATDPITPTFKVKNTVHVNHPIPIPKKSGRTQNYGWSANWSGYVSEQTDSSNTNGYDNITEVQGHWNVPQISTANAPGETHSSTWVGIGGWTSSTNGLIQAGTEQDAIYENNVLTPVYDAWWEVWPYNLEQVLNNLPINPGDQMYVDVSYDATSGDAQFYLEDVTTGQYVPTFSEAGMSQYYDGSTADWIVEKPSDGSGTYYPYLSNFGTEHFTGARATVNGTQQPYRLFSTYWAVELKDNITNNVIANVNMDNVPVNWYNYN